MTAGQAFTAFAPAKLNLGLEVLGRRHDGYHTLWSLVVFADIGDRLSYRPGARFALELAGPFGGSLEGEAENLVDRAAHLLAEREGMMPTGTLRLEKNLPVASGIGGGSADAAATLRLLNLAWEAERSEASLKALGLELGADVPVCVGSRPAVMSGIGERLETAPALPSFGLVLVNPGLQVPTGKVFKQLASPERDPMPVHGPSPSSFRNLDELIAFLKGHPNDLEAPARAVAPEIGDVIGAIAAAPSCRLARMSGSGATCFGIFDSRAEADRAAAALRAAEPQWWCVAAGLYTRGEADL